MRVSSFGCTKPEHLAQRINTLMPLGAALAYSDPQPTTMAEAIVRIESGSDITLFDCHTRQTWVQSFDKPLHDVDVWFRSTVQPKCIARVKLTPSEYVAFINDMESSGLWSYAGEAS